MPGFEYIHPLEQLIISLCLGLLVGLQRQSVEAPLGGIRTFSLVALLGTVCALLADRHGGWMIGLGFAGTVAAMIAGHLSRKEMLVTQQHSGLVTEFAMLLTFSIGVIVHEEPVWLAAALAGLLAVVLQAKLQLHGMVARFDDREVAAIMQFALISLVILPIVPDRAYGPFDVLNPHETWLMVILIVAISLSGYIIYKFYGDRAGALLGGFLGGLISSTASTLSYARRAQAAPGDAGRLAIVILVAWITLYGRVLVEALVVAPQFRALLAPVGIMFLATSAPAIVLWRQAGGGTRGMPPQTNPTELRMAVLFGAVYSAVLFAVACAKHYFGTGGLTLVAFLTGLTETDAITLSTARLVADGRLGPNDGWPLVVVAIAANTVFKAAIAFAAGGKALFLRLLLPSVLTCAAAILLLAFH